MLIAPRPGVREKFSDVYAKFGGAVKEIVFCIGPEGGFSDREFEIAKDSGAHLITLGSRILRAETVTPVIGALVAQQFGEM